MISFEIWHLKCYLPVVYDIVTFIFLAQIPWQFTWEDGSEVQLFYFLVDSHIINPLCIAQAVPEINDVVGVPFEECPEILGYSNRLKLIGMRQWIKDLFCWMNRISDDYNVRYIRNLNYLIDSASDSEQFCLSWCNIDNMMNTFSNNIMAWSDMWYWYGDIVLYTGARNNNDWIGIW